MSRQVRFNRSYAFRLAPEDETILLERAKAAGTKPAAFGRALILQSLGRDGAIYNDNSNIPDAPAFRALIVELGRQGNNLNQISRHLNAGRPLDTNEGLASAIANLQQQIAELRQAVALHIRSASRSRRSLRT